MPSGGLMQLVSYGSEDLYLTGNPQITFFKVVYKRHTNFAYEWVPQYFNPQSSFSTIQQVQMEAPIKRDGDLIRDMSLVLDLPSIYSTDQENFKWIDNIGHYIIHYADFVIGAQRISRQYGQWMNIWSELTISKSKRGSFDELIGNVEVLTKPLIYYGTINDTSAPTIQKRRLRIPLPFWFTEHPGLAVPLIAVQYVEIKIELEFQPLNEWFTIGYPPVAPIQLFENPVPFEGSNHVALRNDLISEGFSPDNVFWKFVNGMNASSGIWNQNVFIDVKYVFLDTPERRVFASAVSEYLITQPERLVFSGLTGGNNQENLSFFHPVKEMIWVFQRDDVSTRNQWSNFTTLPSNFDYPKLVEWEKAVNIGTEIYDMVVPPIGDKMLPSGLTVDQFINFLNCTDVDKLSRKDMIAFDEYFNIFYYGKFIFNQHDRQEQKPHYYYAYQEPLDSHTSAPNDKKQIYMMSFSENPEVVQPSGTANFARFQKAEFQFTLKDRTPVESDDLPTKELYNLFFYVRQINVLRFMNGLAGLVFAN
jgi:hypothetical protein